MQQLKRDASTECSSLSVLIKLWAD